MKNVLITGINGFIGRHIAKALYKNDAYVLYGIGRGKTLAMHDSSDISYMQCDIISEASVNRVYENFPACDVLIHAAASIDFAKGDECLSTNTIGTYHICRLAKLWKCSQFIYLSSIPIIGIPVKLPITEEHDVNPQTIYHISKYAGEQIVDIALDPQTKRTILRLPSPIGRGMRDSVILSIFLKNCYENRDLMICGKGSRRQNYIDVRDIGMGVARVLAVGAEGLYNLAGERSISNLELAKECIDITKSESNIYFQGEDAQDDIEWDISIEKARKKLGFIPQYTVRESIEWIYSRLKGNKT